jgi:hypothetical protein
MGIVSFDDSAHLLGAAVYRCKGRLQKVYGKKVE